MYGVKDMTNDEFQNLVLEELKNIKATMATKDDLEEAISKLPTSEKLCQAVGEQQKDIKAMLEIIDKKVSTIQDTQIVQDEAINILALNNCKPQMKYQPKKK